MLYGELIVVIWLVLLIGESYGEMKGMRVI